MMNRGIYAFLILFVHSIFAFGQTPSWQWAKGAGGVYDDQGNAIAADSIGNSFVTGFFRSNSIAFGSTALTNTNPNSSDIFIAKHDAAGNLSWAKKAGGFSYDYPLDVAVDASDNCYITGFTQGPYITFDTTTLMLPGFTNFFIVKYDSSGDVVWVKGVGSNSSGRSIAVDKNGNSYVAGFFKSDSVIFGNTVLYNANTLNNADIFIAKYDSSGNVVWAKRAGGSKDDLGVGIALDPNGNIYVSGYFDSPFITFDGTPLTVVNSLSNYKEIFLAKYDSSGNLIWGKNAGGSSDDINTGLGVDANGNSYITGSFTSTSVSFDTITLTNTAASYQDIYIARYNTTGTAVWARKAGTNISDAANDIFVDASGNSYVTGYFTGNSILFDSITLTNSNLGAAIFVAKYSKSGDVEWAVKPGDVTQHGFGNGICVDANRNCYVAGSFYSHTIAFDTTTLPNAWTVGNSTSDLFVAKLSVVVTATEDKFPGNENVVLVYPNPGKGDFTIDSEKQCVSIRVTNVAGQVVSNDFIEGTSSLHHFSIRAAPGFYIVELNTAEGKSTRIKVIKE